MDAKLVIVLGLMLVAMVYAVPPPGGEHHLKAEDSVCQLLGRSGKIRCLKELKGDCEDDMDMEDDDDDDDDMDDDNDDDGDDTDDDDDAPDGGMGNNSTETDDDDDDKKSDEKKDDKKDKNRCRRTEPIEFSMHSLTELTAANADVAFDGHAITDFSMEDFKLGKSEEDGEIPHANKVKGMRTSMNITLTNGAMVTIDVFIVKGDGSVDLDGEKTSVKKGMLKFTVTLSDWTWCGAAADGAIDTNEDCAVDVVGAKLELRMLVKSRGKPTKKDGDANPKERKHFDLGANAALELSEKIQVDGEWVDMETDYPMVEEVDDKQYLVVRIARFNNTAVWDPTTDLGNWPDDGDSPITGAATSHITSAFAGIFTILAAMFVL